MNHLSLFSGIGGLDLAAEWAGFRTVGFVERDLYCQRVLARHWPGVPIWDDVQDLHLEPGFAEVISGGFPCQDISTSGNKAGIAGERSGLWREYARIIGMVRPRYVVVENVAALLSRGMGVVLGDLAALGYDAEWHCIPAAAVGAPQLRDRAWIVAYPQIERLRPDHPQPRLFREATPDCAGLAGDCGPFHSPDCERDLWPSDAALVRVADGFPDRVDRIRALGNAVVPQQAYPIFKAIADIELRNARAPAAEPSAAHPEAPSSLSTGKDETTGNT